MWAAPRSEPSAADEAEAESLLPRPARRRDASGAKRAGAGASASEDQFERSMSDADDPPPKPAGPPGTPAAILAQKAVVVILVVVSVWYLTSTGLRDDQNRLVTPTFAPYAPAEPALPPAHRLFDVRAPATSCAGASRVECEVGPAAAIARTLDNRMHALATLLPCWAIFRQHPRARRVLVLRGGLRLGSDSFAARLLDAMGTDVLLPALSPSGGVAGARALPDDPCALHAARLAPARTGWPLEWAPAAPNASALATALAAGAHERVSEVVIDVDEDDPSAHRAGAITAALLAKFVRAAGSITYALHAADVPSLARLLVPDEDAADAPVGEQRGGGGGDGDGGGASGKGAQGARLNPRARAAAAAAPPFGHGNLSVAIGLLEPDGGFGPARANMLRGVLHRQSGSPVGLVVRAASLANAPLGTQARFVRAHGILILSHGAGAESLVFARPCTAVLELFPNFHYRPGLALPLVLAAGGLPFVGYSAAEPERHTWQRLAAIGPVRAEHVLRAPPVTPLSLANFVPTLIAARERCLRETGASALGGSDIADESNEKS
ncbi:hypothetical protein KFE25_007256 [Diacronema lutheri]|uniref:Uncharacterized protein n=1 Tax=Diacronema lutheri TaxID=2081491 RepID=A0A8J6C215_DIALT|nr:hypothetical protein KFE25_007256 [Diacronema lutheri]